MVLSGGGSSCPWVVPRALKRDWSAVEGYGSRRVGGVNDVTSVPDRAAPDGTLHGAVTEPDGTPIGLCGLLREHWLNAPDLAYAFLAEAEGRGYMRNWSVIRLSSM